jgi:hypothetical protein
MGHQGCFVIFMPMLQGLIDFWVIFVIGNLMESKKFGELDFMV